VTAIYNKDLVSNGVTGAETSPVDDAANPRAQSFNKAVDNVYWLYYSAM